MNLKRDDGGRCLRRVGWRMASLLTAVSVCASSSFAATILSKADLRLWQTVHDRAAALTWPWEEGADGATLTFSNRVTHAVLFDTVPRASGEMRGSYSPPVPSMREDVVDVTLSQTAGGIEVAHETASLAYVSGAGGGPITVRAEGTREWKRFVAPRVFAVDPVWQGLVGESGYDVAWPIYSPLKVILR